MNTLKRPTDLVYDVLLGSLVQAPSRMLAALHGSHRMQVTVCIHKRIV